MRWVMGAAVVTVAVFVFWLSRDSDSPTRSQPKRDTATAPSEPARDKPKREAVKVPTPPAEHGVAFKGRAVDGAWQPLEDTEVALVVGDADVVRTRTDADGAFAVRGGVPPPSGWTPVRIELSKGDVGATKHTSLTPASSPVVALGDIVLERVHTLTVRVLHAGTPLRGAQVVASQPWAPTGIVHTDSAGVAVLRLLAPGRHDVRVAAAGYARGEMQVKVPGKTEVTIALGAERRVTVTVVDKGSGQPIEGATIDAHRRMLIGRMVSIQPFSPPLLIAPTDARGQTVFAGLHEDMALQLAVRAKGYPPPQLSYGSVGRTMLKPGVTELEVRLEPPRTIRWPVVKGPVDGTRIKLRPEPGSYLREVPEEGVIEGRHLVVAGWARKPVHAIAVAPDGSLARLWANAGRDVGADITFREPRFIAIFVHEPDGKPVAGVAFVLRNQGNNPMAPAAASSVEGRVRFESLQGQRADVYLLSTAADVRMGRRVGTVDLDKGSGEIDVVLQPEVKLVVTVRIDGKPRIPATYTLGSGNAVLSNVVADGVRGELRVRVRPAESDGVIPVALSAAGFQAARGSTSTGSIAFDLKPAGALEVAIVPPADKQYMVSLQRWSEKSGSWGWAGQPSQRAMPTGMLYELLSAGRYRALDNKSGTTSGPVEVVPGGATATVTLDLSGDGYVSGRVELPDGIKPRDVRIHIEGRDIGVTLARGSRARRDGTFRVRVSGQREVLLYAHHPLLRTANRVKVNGPEEDIVLRLVTGPTATLRLDRQPQPRTRILRRGVPAAVQLFQGSISERPVRAVQCVVKERALTFGGFVPGTYTVWVDAAPFAPVILKDIELKAGSNDLGVAKTSFGSSIRLKIIVKEGQDPPRVGLFASFAGKPTYHRGLNSGGEAEVVLRGLGPGTFVVNGGPVMSRGLRRVAAIIELDGVAEHTMTLDLR